MELCTVEGNRQRLDGGSMFGNAPRALWQRWLAPDEQHRVPLACRCLLVTTPDGRRVLLETGIGVFFEPKLRARFGVQGEEHELLINLAALGVSPADIDVVVLSHLHFDHAGGVLMPYHPERAPRLAFPRATFVVGKRAFERARRPHQRDRASFIAPLQGLLQDSGRLELVTGARSTSLGDGFRLHYSDGHTPGLMLTEVASSQGPLVFASDLIPGSAWVHLPITMGYDRYPERVIDEKQALLVDLLRRKGRLLFTHDPSVACGRVSRDPRGRYTVIDTVTALVMAS